MAGSVMDEKFKFDRPSDVDAALKRSKLKDQPPLVLVLAANTWNPPAVALLRDVDRVRKEGAKYLQVLVLDHDEKDCKSITLSGAAKPVVTFGGPAPALALFYAERVLTMRRADWEDDTKFVGSVSRANLQELLTYAKASGADGHDTLYLDF